MPAFEIDPHLEPGGADAVVVGVVDIEHEIEGAARQPDSGDRDLLEGDLRLGERQPAEGGAGETEGGKGRQQAVEGGRGHSVFSSASANSPSGDPRKWYASFAASASVSARGSASPTSSAAMRTRRRAM